MKQHIKMRQRGMSAKDCLHRVLEALQRKKAFLSKGPASYSRNR